MIIKKKTKIIVVTQKVDINDDNLGSFHNWIEKLAEKADIFVIANYVGKYDLPANVKVFSLGKEREVGRLVKIFKYQWFLLKLLPKSDGVFFHMCPEYVLGAHLLTKFFRKKTLLWYTHKSVNWKLKLAEKLIDKIFTASKESFRLPSKKLEITGHGIDINKFKSQISNLKSDGKFKIITVSRIAEVKNLHLLIETAGILKNRDFNFEIKIAGAPILESDQIYFEKLKNLIKEKKLGDIIEFIGPISNKDIAEFYQSGNLFINLSDTGSLDKAILEAMACGLKILTSNEAFKNILKEDNIVDKNPENIAGKIINLAKSERNYSLVEYATKNHSLDNLTEKIVTFYEKRH
ncbi:MAG: Glycosyltransferase [Parcubacteria group bacterium GW2011_GWD2_40_9]|nr:MAG: Glycosyltransferase [Parcubacteria group bacterium GW2011_GWD2_40_9]